MSGRSVFLVTVLAMTAVVLACTPPPQQSAPSTTAVAPSSSPTAESTVAPTVASVATPATSPVPVFASVRFRAPLTVNLPPPWQVVVDDTRGIVFSDGPPGQGGPWEPGSLQLVYVDNLPTHPCTQHVDAPVATEPFTGNAVEFLAWLDKAVPPSVHLSPADSTDAVPNKLPGVDLRFDSVSPCKAVVVTEWQPGNPLLIKTADEPMRITATDVPGGGVVAFSFAGRRADLSAELQFVLGIHFR